MCLALASWIGRACVPSYLPVGDTTRGGSISLPGRRLSTHAEIYDFKDDNVFVTNKIGVTLNPRVSIHEIAKYYHLKTEHYYIAFNEYVLAKNSTYHIDATVEIMNMDSRIRRAQMLDAHEMQPRSCDCVSQSTSCKTHDGIDVSLRCGCYDHTITTNSFCYIADISTCTVSDYNTSYWTEGLYFRSCDDGFPNEEHIQKQWYLHLIHAPIANRNINGEGVVIAIIDDSIDIQHPDLSVLQNYSKNFKSDVSDDPIESTLSHGTKVAGIAAAQENGIGILGVASGAMIVGFRLLYVFNEHEEYDAFTCHGDRVHIKTCSWGPSDHAFSLYPIRTKGQLGLEYAIHTGRDGKGTIFVFAAGNGGGKQNNCNNDGYANSMYTIAVTAVSSHLKRVSYGEECACLITSAPSSDDRGYRVWTTTVGGAYSTFGGTSAAAPIVSGVVALMLQTNPNLSWRDVQEILLFTSRKNDPGDEGWVTNGVGMHYNHRYGGGVVDAQKAVHFSSVWTTLPPRETYVYEQYPNARIVDTSDNIFRINCTNSIRAEHIELVVNITHKYRLDLDIRLESPSGTVSRLTTPVASNESVIATTFADNSRRYDDYINWSFKTVLHWGENTRGIWYVYINDNFAGNDHIENTIKTLRVIMHGHIQAHPGIYRDVSIRPSIPPSQPLIPRPPPQPPMLPPTQPLSSPPLPLPLSTVIEAALPLALFGSVFCIAGILCILRIHYKQLPPTRDSIVRPIPAHVHTRRPNNTIHPILAVSRVSARELKAPK